MHKMEENYLQGLRSSAGMLNVSEQGMGGLDLWTILNMFSGRLILRGWSALSQNNLDKVIFLIEANCAGVNWFGRV